MKNIIKDIKEGTFKNIYLLYGNEEYLVKQYRDKLKEAILDGDISMNYSYFEGKGIDTVEIVSIGNTMPFFADRRLILIENSGLFKSPKEGFDQEIEKLPESTYIVFVENEVDKRGKLYKLVGKKGYAAEFITPDEKTIYVWINSICKANITSMAVEDMNFLIEHTGMDMNIIKHELDKLLAYTYGKTVITREDISEVCISQATSKIFLMLDAIGERNMDKAINYYHDLLNLREPAMRILYLVTRHYNILMLTKNMLSMKTNSKDIAKALAVPPFSIGKYVSQCGKYTYEYLLKCVDMCQDTDYRIKRGLVNDTVGVELLIAMLVKGQN